MTEELLQLENRLTAAIGTVKSEVKDLHKDHVDLVKQISYIKGQLDFNKYAVGAIGASAIGAVIKYWLG